VWAFFGAFTQLGSKGTLIAVWVSFGYTTKNGRASWALGGLKLIAKGYASLCWAQRPRTSGRDRGPADRKQLARQICWSVWGHFRLGRGLGATGLPVAQVAAPLASPCKRHCR